MILEAIKILLTDIATCGVDFDAGDIIGETIDTGIRQPLLERVVGKQQDHVIVSRQFHQLRAAGVVEKLKIAVKVCILGGVR